MRPVPRGPAFALARCASASAFAALAIIASAVVAAVAHAQEFAAPAPAGPEYGASVMLERALPSRETDAHPVVFAAEGAVTRWSGIDDFTTRSAAVMGAWRAGVIAAGISSTGDAEIGWNAAALAAGVATGRAGAALRVIGRRDRSPPEVGAPRASGLEVGGGFWSAIGSSLTLWMSAPGMIVEGEPPPLERGLETGLRAASGALSAWAVWVTPSRGDATPSRSAGLACRTREARLWLEARSAPLRAAAGVELRRGSLRVAFEDDEHPVLGETLRISLSTRGGRAP